MDISKIKIDFSSYLVIIIIFIPVTSFSNDDLFFGVGVGSDGISAARFAKKYDSGKLLDTSINKSTEIGINFWDGDTVNNNSKSSNLSITYSGILSKSFNNNFFLSSGMGIALLSDDKIGERNLGTSLQFESRFEFGYKTTNTSSSLNIFHYSNAGAANDNSGVNILMINLSHLF